MSYFINYTSFIMKITKRLSLMSTIDQRIVAPKPHSPWLERFLYSLRN